MKVGDKIWVTKYAPNKVTRTTIESFGEGDGWVCAVWPFRHLSVKVGRGAFLSEKEAKNDFLKRRLKKMQSLRRQIARVTELQFEVTEHDD